jgi:hypothetical protein
MLVLIACEESQTVCKEFRKLGHEAFSCDVVAPSGGHPEWHLHGDVLQYLDRRWDLMIAHPPCTYLTNAGIGWFNIDKHGDKARKRHRDRETAFEFFIQLANADIPRIAVENPVGYVNSHWRTPDQIIHPYYFGDPEKKRTCLWLKNLPKLVPTDIVEPRIYGEYKTGKNKGKKIYWSDSMPPSKDRAANRSKTFLGIAKAMASQWGNL